jgi:hypothetical protein
VLQVPKGSTVLRERLVNRAPKVCKVLRVSKVLRAYKVYKDFRVYKVFKDLDTLNSRVHKELQEQLLLILR